LTAQNLYSLSGQDDGHKEPDFQFMYSIFASIRQTRTFFLLFIYFALQDEVPGGFPRMHVSTGVPCPSDDGIVVDCTARWKMGTLVEGLDLVTISGFTTL